MTLFQFIGTVITAVLCTLIILIHAAERRWLCTYPEPGHRLCVVLSDERLVPER
jgi:hypothetical protein